MRPSTRRMRTMILHIFPVLISLLLVDMAAAQQTLSEAELERGWGTNTKKRSIDLSELLSGGVPRDGIPSLDRPVFITIEQAHVWLKPQEPVIFLMVEGETRAYPLQILTWHEIVNDEFNGIPITVTICPLCYSAIAFKRTVNKKTYTFGVSGLLRHSDLVMYDRQSLSLWQQLTGEAIVGDLTGAKLEKLPAQIISFQQFSEAHPQGRVLSRDTGFDRSYGQNPYVGYDNVRQRPFLYNGPNDGRLRPLEKVIAISLGNVDMAYPYRLTRERRVIHDEVGGQSIVILHDDGAVSALDQEEISRSTEIGSAGVFIPFLDGNPLHFKYTDGRFVDQESNSTWDITGQALSGALKGRQLESVPHGIYFSFAWFAFKPETELYQ